MGERIGGVIEAVVTEGTTTIARAMILTEFGEIILFGLRFLILHPFLTLKTDFIHSCILVQLRDCIARCCIACMVFTSFLYFVTTLYENDYHEMITRYYDTQAQGAYGFAGAR